jgi:hypothetical protein
MDIFSLLLSVWDFAVLWIPLAFISFIIAKLLLPLRKKIEEKFNFNWLKSTFLTNFIVIFIIIFLFYIYFILLGALTAPARTPELEYDFIENILMILIAVVRIGIATVMLSFFILFFEFIASLVTDALKKKDWHNVVKEFVGVLIAAFVFLVLFLFIFNWAAFGLFVYIFYGGVSPLPLMIY